MYLVTVIIKSLKSYAKCSLEYDEGIETWNYDFHITFFRVGCFTFNYELDEAMLQKHNFF